MAAEITSEGVKVGEILLGSIDEEADPMLWVVTRVIGKNKCEAVAAVRDIEIKIGIKTFGINGEDHQFKRVRFVKDGSHTVKNRLGSIIPF